MKILFGYDGSTGAEAVCDDLSLAGLPRDMEAVVMSVGEVWLPSPLYGMLQSNLGHEPRSGDVLVALADKGRDLLRSRFPEWRIETEPLFGSVSASLLKKAQDWRPDLIVLGSHGHSALGRFFGSVSQRVVTEARCSVRVCRPRANKKDRHLSLVIGIDGSPGADLAVRTVARRSWPRPTDVRLVTTLGPFTLPFIGGDPAGAMLSAANMREQEAAFASAQEIQSKAEEPLTAAGLRVSRVVKEGDPKRTLLQEVTECGADCVFVGSSGLSRMERLLLGSVASAVVSRATCSVEVVRTPG